MQNSLDEHWRSSLEAIRTTHSSLAEQLLPLRFLSDLLSWWRRRGNEISSLEFINQDEFTIDIVVPIVPNSEWLVLDCT